MLCLDVVSEMCSNANPGYLMVLLFKKMLVHANVQNTQYCG